DLSLPTYAGAVSPKGGDPWDWQWTWDVRVNKLLTVSSDRQGAGRFRTIAAALKVSRPRMTVRVLDDAVYADPLILDNSERHEGLLLEAVKRATLALDSSARRALVIEGVGGVRVKGFRVREPQPTKRERFSSVFVAVLGPCPGTVLEELDIAGE